MAKTTRAEREKRTVEAMIRLYCRHNHRSPNKELCPECQELLAYAKKRAENCKFGEDKPVCANCPIHCYKKDMREKIRAVMRYAGPRMIIYHPVMAVQHVIDKRKKPPTKTKNTNE